MANELQTDLTDRLNRIREIGRHITELRQEAKEARRDLFDRYHHTLPKQRGDDDCAMIVVGESVAYLRPVFKEETDKVIDATVTFDPVTVAT